MERQQLNEWLEHSISESNKHPYTHRLLKEKPEQRDLILDNLRKYIEQAHADAVRHLRRLAAVSLDPLTKPTFDPAEGYPEKLPDRTLKGYLGEVLAGLIAESFPHFNHDGWIVPVYSFRFHETAFDYLERVRQGGTVGRHIVGRTGDDTLAFLRDESGIIKKVLACEAKCAKDFNTKLNSDAHRKASEAIAKPVEIPRLIRLLQEYLDDAELQKWRESLYSLYFKDDFTDYERCDLVSYACGKSPSERATWIDRDSPHAEYQAGRKLETVEIHLSDLDELVKLLYGVTNPVDINNDDE